jgi:hypothetical protein
VAIIAASIKLTGSWWGLTPECPHHDMPAKTNLENPRQVRVELRDDVLQPGQVHHRLLRLSCNQTRLTSEHVASLVDAPVQKLGGLDRTMTVSQTNTMLRKAHRVVSLSAAASLRTFSSTLIA